MATEAPTTQPSEPKGSGVEPVQTEASPDQAQALVHIESSQGINQIPLTGELKDIGQIRGEAAMALLCNHINRLEGDLREVRRERNCAIAEAKERDRDYHIEKGRADILSERLAGVSRIKNLQKFVGAIGGIIEGVSIPLLIATSSGWSIAAAVVGGLLLIAGFWPANNREAK